MKAIITILLLLPIGLAAQTYTIDADTATTCRIMFIRGGNVDVSLKLSEIRYNDIGGGTSLLLFDGVQSISVMPSHVGYPNIAAIKNDIDRWADICGQ